MINIIHKIIISSIAIMVLSCCAKQNLQIVKIEDIPAKKIEPEIKVNDVCESVELGPFIWPESHNLNSISINYFTTNEEKTTIFFSMAGEIDWVRIDETLTKYHSMVFDNLEEGAVYRFAIQNSGKSNYRNASIRTVPYGDDYHFFFIISTIDENSSIDKQIISTNEPLKGIYSGPATNFNETPPNFLVLMSGKTNVNEKSFYEYYKLNKHLLSSTIIVPMFEFSIQNKKFSLSKNGLINIRYKNVNIIMIYNDQIDSQLAGKYVSSNIDDYNYLLIGNIGKIGREEIIKKYSMVVNGIFQYKQLDDEDGSITKSNQFQVVNISRKAKFAVK